MFAKRAFEREKAGRDRDDGLFVDFDGAMTSGKSHSDGGDPGLF